MVQNASSHLILFRYVELYPEYRPHYRPFGFGYGIYVRVFILYTQKRKEKCVPKYNLYWSTHGGAWLKPSRVFPGVNDNGYKQVKWIEWLGKRNNDANELNKLNKQI